VVSRDDTAKGIISRLYLEICITLSLDNDWMVTSKYMQVYVLRITHKPLLSYRAASRIACHLAGC
jgi:hypothetical protein